MFVFWNPCARAKLHQQKRALKLYSATLNLQFPIEIWSFDVLKACKQQTHHSSRGIFHTSILLTMSAQENTRKTILSQRLWQENFVVILTSFIRLKNQVTNVRVVKRTRHKKNIDRLPVCVLRSFELFFIRLNCESVSELASLSEGSRRYGCVPWQSSYDLSSVEYSYD